MSVAPRRSSSRTTSSALLPRTTLTPRKFTLNECCLRLSAGAAVRRAVLGVATGRPRLELRGAAVLPRGETPRRCSRRYSVASCIPKRSRIAAVETVASPYRRTTSSCWLDVSFGRRPGRRLALSSATALLVAAVGSVVSPRCIFQPYTTLDLRRTKRPRRGAGKITFALRDVWH